ncbi:MAG: GGDEF domain-containing protein [Gammaproteobacteria bacterium]|nr:GGDEF domain-containing protein [Gammaproteobacteria bacterium]
MPSHYADDADEAAKIARTALPLANKFELPVNPVNYTVLYEYVSGNNKPLREAADKEFKRRDKISQELIDGLYQLYLAPQDTETLEKMREGIRNLMTRALKLLSTVDSSETSYNQKLQKGIETLSKNIDIDEIREVIGNVISETRRKLSSGKELRLKLKATNDELESLRDEVASIRNEVPIDPLTGSFGRNSFDKKIIEQCSLATESSNDLSLLMVDIDHLSRINEKFGHKIGDEVLKYVARLINDVVRGGDVVSRYGDEEFTIILPETALKGAKHVANNICKRLGEKPLARKSTGDSVGKVTVSIGVAQYKVNEVIEDFISRSEDALFTAKDKGRNCVIIDQEV